MDITYFNWHEIESRARRDPAAILILTYAQTSLYNEISAKQLLQKLHIHHIPQFLFSSKTFTQYRTKLQCNYKTDDPQSYFRNANFLTYDVDAKSKVSYLRALSMRRISDNSNRIPRRYFNKVAYNPFIQTDEEYIYFPLESSL